MSRFHIERVQKARLYTDRTFHSLVNLRRLATWGLGPEPSVEALAHEITVRRRKFSLSFLLSIYLLLQLTSFLLGVAMMKENKDKEVMDEVVKQGVQSQPRPPVGEKRKNISSRVDLGDLPSRCGMEKNIGRPSLKTSNPFLSSLIKSPQCRYLIWSPRTLRLRKSHPQSTHPPCLSLLWKFLNTFLGIRTWLGKRSQWR